MNTTTKPRRGLRFGKLTNQAMALDMEAAAAPPSPAAVQAQAWALCKRSMRLLEDASAIGEMGDMFDTITDAAESYLIPTCEVLALSRGIVKDEAGYSMMDALTANAVLMGVRALKPQESQDLLTEEAMRCIAELVGLLDQPAGFWPEEPEFDMVSFDAGRDLALKLMQDAHRLGESQDDTPEAWRYYRHGGAQNRFALPHLSILIANPEFLDGFSAMLSCWLYQCWAGWTDPEQLEGIPSAEFEAGVPGEDGTKPDPEAVSKGTEG